MQTTSDIYTINSNVVCVVNDFMQYQYMIICIYYDEKYIILTIILNSIYLYKIL